MIEDMEINKYYRLKEGVIKEQLEAAYDLVDDDNLDNDYYILLEADKLRWDGNVLHTINHSTLYNYSKACIEDEYSISDFFEEVVDEVTTDEKSFHEILHESMAEDAKSTFWKDVTIGPTIQAPPTVPTDTVSIPVIEGSISAIAQVAHTKSETDELVAEISNNKHFAALLEAGDVVCSGYRAMKVLIEENNFNCTPQEILNMIAVKNNMRGYYDNVD